MDTAAVDSAKSKYAATPRTILVSDGCSGVAMSRTPSRTTETGSMI